MAQTSYSLLFEPSWSAITGTESQLAIHRGIIELEGKFLPAKLFDESTAWTKAAGIGYRLTKAILLDNNIDYLPVIIQHEAFGHGARFREFGKEGVSIHVNLGPPYGDASGFATYLRSTKTTSLYEDAAIHIAGVEASQRLAQVLFLNWIQRGKMHYHQMFTAMIAMNNLPLYAWFTNEATVNNPLCNNDVIAYYRHINLLYQYAGINRRVSFRDIQQQALLSLLSPWQYFIAYGYGKEYTWDGNEEWEMPMISLGSLRYLPSIRFALGLTGTEGYFENFISAAPLAGLIYYRQTLDSPLPVYGLGAELRNIVTLSWLNLGAKCDVWSQPSLHLGSERFDVSERSLGVSSTLITQIWLPEFNGYRAGVISHLGYKTRGFVQNEPLEAGFMFRFGFSFMTPTLSP